MASARHRGTHNSQPRLLFFKSDLKSGQFGQRFRARMPLGNSEMDTSHTFISNPNPQCWRSTTPDLRWFLCSTAAHALQLLRSLVAPSTPDLNPVTTLRPLLAGFSPPRQHVPLSLYTVVDGRSLKSLASGFSNALIDFCQRHTLTILWKQHNLQNRGWLVKFWGVGCCIMWHIYQ